MSPETFSYLNDDVVLYRYHHIYGNPSSTKRKLLLMESWFNSKCWFLTIDEAKIYHYLLIREENLKEIYEQEIQIKNKPCIEFSISLKKLKNIKKEIDDFSLLFPEEFL
jgi:hypothetical protein